MDPFSRAEAIRDDLRRMRRQLHQIPEVGLSLPQTRAYVENKLRACGIAPRRCGHSVMAVIGRGEPVLLLRADMDALEMKEESGECFAAQGNAFHGCGHDLHTAMLLGAARLLKESERAGEYRGCVRLLFQAGEEVLTGASDAIACGALDALPIEGGGAPTAALALHVAAGSALPGMVFYQTEGAMMCAADAFQIEVFGVGGHGAYPDRAVDPIAIAVRIYSALEHLRIRLAAPDIPCALTVGCFSAGEAGEGIANSIPSRAVLKGTLRTGDEALRRLMKEQMASVSGAVAQALGGKAETSFCAPTPALVCDPNRTRQVIASISDLPGLSFHSGMRACASEDFAQIAARIPATMLYLGAGFSDERGAYTAHHPCVRFHEDVLPIGCTILMQAAFAAAQERSGEFDGQKEV